MIGGMNDDGEVEICVCWSACRGSPSSIHLACFKQEEQTKLMYFSFSNGNSSAFENSLDSGFSFASVPARCTLRPVKPCPGVPGIHLNADRTVSMTAALLCGAGASPVHKDRGGSADHNQIEDHAHAQKHAWEMLPWLKNGAHGRRARLARARTPHSRVSEVASTFAQGLPVWSSSWARITSPMYWQHV